MAKRHVVDYYKGSIKQYLHLNNQLKKMQEEYEKGNITDEQMANFIPLCEAMKANCEGLSYIMFLLNMPIIRFPWSKSYENITKYFVNKKLDKDSIFEGNKTLMEDIEQFLSEYCDYTKGEESNDL